MTTRRPQPWLALLLLACAASRVRAQESSAPGPADFEGALAIDDAQDAAKVQIDPGSAPKTKKKQPKQELSIAAGAFKLRAIARFDGDMRAASRAIGLNETRLDWSHHRIGVSGSVSKRLTFELERELDSATSKPWKDVFANVRVAKPLEVRGGRFKVPFGRDALTGGASLSFVNRSLIGRQLSPGRDVGAMAHGRLFKQIVEYNAGYFVHDGDRSSGSSTDGAGKTLAARGVVAPFAKSRSAQRLELGVNVTRSEIAGLGLDGQTVFADAVFFDRVYVSGRRLRLGADVAWSAGPVSLSGEYIRVADERRGMGVGSSDLPTVTASGWYAAATWALTGESKRGRVEPRRSLFSGGPGALEVAARFEALRFDNIFFAGSLLGLAAPSGFMANADHVSTVGLNWYVDRHIRLQTNVIIESVSDPQRSPAPASSGRFSSAVFRLQFVL